MLKSALMAGFAAATISAWPAQGADQTGIPDFSGIWGRNSFDHETLASGGPGPLVNMKRVANGASSLNDLRERAHTAALETVPMIARRGRASFLGERSQGHMDPGARSSELIVAAVCHFLEGRL